jgi:hypothetical protein
MVLVDGVLRDGSRGAGTTWKVGSAVLPQWRVGHGLARALQIAENWSRPCPGLSRGASLSSAPISDAAAKPICGSPRRDSGSYRSEQRYSNETHLRFSATSAGGVDLCVGAGAKPRCCQRRSSEADLRFDQAPWQQTYEGLMLGWQIANQA